MGLPDCSIHDIIQDQSGYLWLGTACGIYRFDGYAFHKYSLHPDGKTNHVNGSHTRFLLQDHMGIIWAAMLGGGLYRYSAHLDRFFPFQLQNQNLDNRITTLLEDQSGRIWMGTSKGLNVLNLDRTETIQYVRDETNARTLMDERITSLFEDRHGIIWIGTMDGRLYRFDPSSDRFEYIPLNRFIKTSQKDFRRINTIYVDTHDYLWIGFGRKGLYRLSPQKNEMVRSSFDPYDQNEPVLVLNIQEDHFSNLWISTTRGLYQLPLSVDTGHLSRPIKVADIAAKSLLIDRFDQLWVGQSKGGLTHIDLFQHHHTNTWRFPQTSEIKNQNINTMCEDTFGNLWLTTQQSENNLWMLDPQAGILKSIDLHSMIADRIIPPGEKRILSVTADNDGSPWLLMQGGVLLKIDSRNQKIIQRSLIKINRASLLQSIMMDHQGKLWSFWGDFILGPLDLASTNSNPVLRKSINNQRFKHGQLARLKSMVLLIYEGSKTGIWSVTSNGQIYRYNQKSDELKTFEFDAPEWMQNAFIFNVFEDSQGWVWLCTELGLLKIDAEQNRILKHYTTREGLPNNVVKGVIQDDDGHFWIATLDGLSRLDAAQEDITNFGVLETFYGLPFINTVVNGRGMKSSTGQIYFPTRNGLISFEPEFVTAQSTPPQVLITNVHIYDDKAPEELSDSSSKINFLKNQKQGDTLSIQYKHNTVQFNYVGLHFRSPQQNQYAVMLEGIDSDWQFVRSRRSVTYAHLSPGDYIFRVKASNSHGVWNKTGASYQFKILKPFWATWWFVTAVLCTIFILVFLIIKLQVYRIERKSRLLEEHVADRTKTLEETQNKLLLQEKLSAMSKISRLEKDITSISEQTRRQIAEALHDDICPHFLGVEAQVEVLANRLQKLSSDQVPFVREIHESVLEGIEKTRNVGRIIAPNYSMEKGLAATLEEVVAHVKQMFNVACNLTLHGNIETLDKDHGLNLYYIAQEAVYNAIKHGQPNEIEVSIMIGPDGNPTLRVIDDGCGIDTDNLSRGMGINIMKYRATRIGGKLIVGNSPSGGGMVELTFGDSK